MRRFICTEGESNKFWNIELTGATFTVSYGRAGRAGRTQTNTFPSEAAARKEHGKLIKQKLAKGYVEDTGAPAPVAGLREALEVALADNPEDVAAHMAYADYLQEQGDPRGELIQVQLALEDEGKSAAERKELRKRENRML